MMEYLYCNKFYNMFFQEYEKLGFIGKGAFASVYKVRHADLGYVRALKVCNQFIEDENDKAWQTFLSECRLLLRIGNGSHPNIVRIYPPRLLDNRAVVEMDCVEGDSLDRYVADNKFIPIEEFYRFAQQIVGAVAYCHVDVYRFQMDPVADNLSPNPADARKYLISSEKERELIAKYGVVHNDLHSNNIIRRDYDGQYILLDFGLAIQDRHCVKSSSRFDGAIEYCSPEKLDRGEVTPQSDVYSLGILMYEVLAGRVPFKCDSSGDGFVSASATNRVYMQHLKEMPPSIFELRKQAFESIHPDETYTLDYPQELENIILKCLAKNPTDRYANAKELLMDLRKVEKLQPRVADTVMGATEKECASKENIPSDAYRAEKVSDAGEKGMHDTGETDMEETAGAESGNGLLSLTDGVLDKRKNSNRKRLLCIGGIVLAVGTGLIFFVLSRDRSDAMASENLGGAVGFLAADEVPQLTPQEQYATWFEEGKAAADSIASGHTAWASDIPKDYYYDAQDIFYAERGDAKYGQYFDYKYAEVQERLIHSAVDYNNKDSQYLLGCVYANGGYGVPANRSLAYYMFNNAANNGHPKAMFYLARDYCYDPETKFYWMNKSAEAGDMEAQYNLAQSYETGAYTDIDLMKSLHLYVNFAKNYGMDYWMVGDDIERVKKKIIENGDGYMLDTMASLAQLQPKTTGPKSKPKSKKNTEPKADEPTLSPASNSNIIFVPAQEAPVASATPAAQSQNAKVTIHSSASVTTTYKVMPAPLKK